MCGTSGRDSIAEVKAVCKGKRQGEIGMVKTIGRYEVFPLLMAVLIAVLLLAGCADVSPRAGHLTSVTGKTSPPRIPDMGTGAALHVYRAMWRDWAIASETSDALSPFLGDHAAGGALELMRYGLKKSKREHVVAKGRPRVHPEVVSATGRKVVLVDCVDERRWLLYKLNGELLNDVPGGHFKADATVRRSSTGWHVTHLYVHQVGTC
jgi:hypothetical protein